MMWKGFGSSAGQGETTLIAPGAVIDGSITFAGILEIEGRVNGNIFAAGDEQAVVRVLQGGHVHGNVSAPLIVVNGTVTGNVHSTDHAELAPRAVINGDVRYNLLEMSKGAQVNGRLLFNGGSSGPGAGAAEPTQSLSDDLECS
ncbi:MAG: cell shape determination protein CcmA [Deltaproteobacteria bacterium]|nr:cell shape determination protein CcmA [Deltaproteobacteria bacterium]